MMSRTNTTSPFMVEDWNGRVVSTHRSYEAAIAAADRLTSAAGSCIPAVVLVRKAWADAQTAKGRGALVAQAKALCADQ